MREPLRFAHAMRLGSHLEGAQLSVRAAVGAALSLALAAALGLEFPIYAFLAAVIVTDLSPAETRRLGWRRVVATVVGATCGATLSLALPVGPLAVGLGVLAAMLLCNVVRMKEGAKVGGYIAGIVVLSYGARPWSYAFYRLLETLLGVAVAWGVSLVPKLLHSDDDAEPGRDAGGRASVGANRGTARHGVAPVARAPPPPRTSHPAPPGGSR